MRYALQDTSRRWLLPLLLGALTLAPTACGDDASKGEGEGQAAEGEGEGEGAGEGEGEGEGAGEGEGEGEGEGRPVGTGPFISEYVEGSSSNKALEIYNAGPSAVEAASCEIRLYANGAADPATIQLQGDDLEPGAVFVICNSSIDAAVQPRCDQSVASLSHNGDDALALACGGQVLDIIGRIGERPDDGWPEGAALTKDHTLRRKCSVTQGDTNGADAYDPTAEWDVLDKDTFDGLGAHCE